MSKNVKKPVVKEEPPVKNDTLEETFKLFGIQEKAGKWALVVVDCGKESLDIKKIDVVQCRTKPKALIEMRRAMFYNGIDP